MLTIHSNTDGSVVTFGSYEFPDESPCNGDCIAAPTAQLAADVVDVVAGFTALAALKADGSVVAWGSTTGGGDTTRNIRDVSAQLVNVTSLHAAWDACAALKNDGSVVVWGNEAANVYSTECEAFLAGGVETVFGREQHSHPYRHVGKISCRDLLMWMYSK